jgi:hypothetical protein
LLVEILAREQPLSVGQEAELACRAVGSRPPAIITWWLDEKQLPVHSQKVHFASLFEDTFISISGDSVFF